MTPMSPIDYRVKVLPSDGDKLDVLVLVDNTSWKLLQTAWFLPTIVLQCPVNESRQYSHHTP